MAQVIRSAKLGCVRSSCMANPSSDSACSSVPDFSSDEGLDSARPSELSDVCLDGATTAQQPRSAQHSARRPDRSLDARVRRRQRAIDRGFLVPKPNDPSKSFIEVPTHLKPQATAMIKGKVLKSTREEQLGFTTHSTRIAALSAFRANITTEEQFASDSDIVKKQNRANHGPSKKNPDGLMLMMTLMFPSRTHSANPSKTAASPKSTQIR